MSDHLKCNFEVRTGEGLRYWFPLLYDLCITHGLKFVNPYFTQQSGHYLYNKDFNVDAADGPFKDMWDKVYAGFDIGVTFWLILKREIRNIMI